jgi:hypothetical protein
MNMVIWQNYQVQSMNLVILPNKQQVKRLKNYWVKNNIRPQEARIAANILRIGRNIHLQLIWP